MFHSNQELKISGDFGHRNDFLESLKFALAKSGYMEYFTRSNKPCQCAFQVSANKDAYYIGALAYDTEPVKPVMTNKVVQGQNITAVWERRPGQFDFDIEIIAKIAEQQVCKMEFPAGYSGDGSSHKGFLIEEAERWAYDKDVGLKKAHHAVIKITPFTCYYSK